MLKSAITCEPSRFAAAPAATPDEDVMSVNLANTSGWIATPAITVWSFENVYDIEVELLVAFMTLAAPKLGELLMFHNSF